MLVHVEAMLSSGYITADRWKEWDQLQKDIETALIDEQIEAMEENQ
jgi:hypothetical protein